MITTAIFLRSWMRLMHRWCSSAARTMRPVRLVPSSALGGRARCGAPCRFQGKSSRSTGILTDEQQLLTSTRHAGLIGAVILAVNE
jgi:hypothetical protein